MSNETSRKMRVGLIVNPVAGIGGRVGLKGSDGAEIQKKALELGARPEAPDRAAAALRKLGAAAGRISVITCQGGMGEDECRAAGLSPEQVLPGRDAGATSPEDTVQAARAMSRAGVDLLLFAGGDGTARNIYEGAGDRVTVLGIPAGVKIHSGVFALNPASAGSAALRYLEQGAENSREAEVMDLDEDAYRRGEVRPRLYGFLRVPCDETRIQHVKARSVPEEGELTSIAAQLIDGMEPGVYYAVGAGTTTRRVMECLDLPNTLIGVDVIRDKKLVASDVTERQLWEIAQEPGSDLRVILTVIGGQGHVFGRGNQQISPRIIRRLGMERILLAATKRKLLSLPGHRLIADTGDPELDRELAGYYRVAVGAREQMICRLTAGDE